MIPEESEVTMVGRPRREATPEQRLEIHRLARKYGQATVAAKLGLPVWMVRSEMQAIKVRRAPAVPWTEAENDVLEELGGSVSAKQIVGELRRRGHVRSLRAVQDQMVTVLRLGRRDSRADLTVVQVAALLGRGEGFVRDEIGRKRLRAYDIDGAWRVYPSSLREYVLGDLDRADWLKCERRELLSLLMRQWGVSDEERKRKAKAKQGRA